MRDAYQVTKVRAAEAALLARLPEGTLMQRAAAGLASVCASLLREAPGGVYGARVVILAGTGDNGGDALYAGERLARRGAAVTAIQAGQRIHLRSAAALTAAGGRTISVAAPADPSGRYDAGHEVRRAIGHADLIIDGLLGIGGKGGLREPYATLAQLAVNAGNALTVAVDLPSGIDADSGAVEGPAVRADVTVTFGAVKPGLLIDPGKGHAGVVELVDIGLAPYLAGGPDARAPQSEDIAELIPRPTPESDKYRRGVLGLLAGSDKYTGAALLATGGAVRGGAGMVRLVTYQAAAATVRQLHPEVVITELAGETRDRSEVKDRFSRTDEGFQFPDDVGRVQAWVAGPGMGVSAEAEARLAGVLATRLPVLIDADGLTLLAGNRQLLPRPAPTLITPHAGELGRLLGVDPADVAARRLEHARRAATEFGVCVLLKGSTTVVAPPDSSDPVLVNTTGTSWLATAGTGDVLAGLAGALLAQGMLPPQAAIAAAYLHGLAARLAAGGGGAGGGDGAGGAGGGGGGGRAAPIGASDVVEALRLAFRALLRVSISMFSVDNHAQVRVELGAITANIAALRAHVAPAAVMAVVKADGYGHGAVPAARAALRGGADWLGVVHVAEALELRRAGLDVPLLCLMSIAEHAHADAIAADVDLAAGSADMVRRLAAAAAVAGRPARVHLKADTGLSRGGAVPADWPSVLAAASAARDAGRLDIVGLWSHFASADEPGHPSIEAQLAAFKEALAVAESAGIAPPMRHIANTAAALDVPRARHDMVRVGGGSYGLATLPGGAPPWLRPAMTLSARLALVKRVPAGSGVSYGHRYTTARAATLGLVPLGYADGVPRAATGLPLVFARGRRWPIAGTVCMDQFVIDFGDEPVAEGDEVVLFGPGDDGEPTAQEWGEALGTISYEIVTGIGARVRRSYRE
jgi:alanine racemase